jgi:Flp pilus assembly protein CpaB
MTDSYDPGPVGRLVRLRRVGRRLLLSRRRPVAALCAGVAVLGVVHAVRPPSPATVAVTVAARDLDSGTVVTPADVTTRRYPAAVAPGGSDPAAVGRTLAGPVRAGEPITDVRLVGPSLVAGYPDRVALPVRIADADAVGLLQTGDRVDLVAADPRRGSASYVAIDVPVLSLPVPSAGEVEGGAAGRLIVVAASPSDVDAIAAAAAGDLLSVVISR